jgi:hypothetical protein
MTHTSPHANNYIYAAANTYYITIHSNTIPLPIHRGTLQGDTLSPFLFTIFMEPLLRWLAVGSRGYCTTNQLHEPSSAIIAYDDHGYADEINITAGTINGLKIEIEKLHFFSSYKGLQLETNKCEATGALWALGKPLNNKSLTTLQEYISTITFPYGSRNEYLPSNKSYKMIGVHVNMVLDSREHQTHIIKDVRKLAKTLAKRKLSPSHKTTIVEQLLKFKYYATHLGVFNERQLSTMDGILYKATRQTIGLLPNSPRRVFNSHSKKLSWGSSPLVIEPHK